MSPRVRRLIGLSVGVLLLTGAGCIQKRVEGDQTVFAFERWVQIGVILIGLLALPAGWFLRRRSARLGYGLIIAGPLALIFLAPMLFSDEVRIDDRHFESRHGFWWSPTTHVVAFDDLSQIHLRVEVKQGRRGKSYSYYFDGRKKSGGQETVPLGDLMKEAAVEILVRAKANNIPITGLEQLE